MADGLALDQEQEEDDGGEEGNLLQFKETPAERRLRSTVFLREVIPWWLAPVGYGGLAVLSTIFIPMVGVAFVALLAANPGGSSLLTCLLAF